MVEVKSGVDDGHEHSFSGLRNHTASGAHDITADQRVLEEKVLCLECVHLGDFVTAIDFLCILHQNLGGDESIGNGTDALRPHPGELVAGYLDIPGFYQHTCSRFHWLD